eukprot:SAG11_NODE_5448_length_1556_cov_2.730954_2_plen_120_part_00
MYTVQHLALGMEANTLGAAHTQEEADKRRRRAQLEALNQAEIHRMVITKETEQAVAASPAAPPPALVQGSSVLDCSERGLGDGDISHVAELIRKQHERCVCAHLSPPIYSLAIHLQGRL